MSDPQNQTPPEGGAPPTPPAPTDAEFDWTGFFLTDGPAEPQPGTPAPPAPVAGGDDDEDDPPDRLAQLEAQLKEAQATAAKAVEMAGATQHQTQMQTAIAAWKEQASPAEVELSDLLLESKSPEELKKNAAIVRNAAAKLDATAQSREARIRREMEEQMQREFGIPIPPTFTPVPEEEKVNQLIKDGDMTGAASALLKGVFNS